MATSLNPSNSWHAPFWGKSSAYVGGRDPLGLQTTSVATYSRLLPGITNVTNRVRYWSFYCWLVSLYSKRVHRTGEERFVNFMRRGEFTLAVAIERVAPEEMAVSGKDKARRAAQDLPLDLKKYADRNVQGKTLRYWEMELGAFGQYFAGVLTELGLIEKNEHDIFVCTDKTRNERYALNLDVSGVELAEAFREAVGHDIEERFFDALERGIVTSEDLEAFGAVMKLSAIRPESSEWELLKQLMTGRDLPGHIPRETDTYLRRHSIRLFLDFCRLEKERTVLDFLHWIGGRKGVDLNGRETDVAFGWYFYVLNEYWHIANELIFNAFLERLRTNDFARLEDFVPDFLKEMVSKAVGGKKTSQNITAGEWMLMAEDENDETDNETAYQALEGFKSILTLFHSYGTQLDQFEQFGRRLKIERPGNFAQGLRMVEAQLHRPLYDFFEWFLLRHIVNRHLFVAMDKLATTGVNTQKFRLEERVLYFIKPIGVGYTNPRLSQLIQFLRDLKVLDPDLNLTDTATRFLEPENPATT